MLDFVELAQGETTVRYLFATDGSKHAGKAFDYLLTFARPRLDQVQVVAVPVYLFAGSPDVSSPPIAAVMQRIRSKARAVAEVMAARSQARGIRTTVSVPEGKRAETILAAAQAFRADLVVMGGGGLKGLRGAVLGSTAAAVLDRANRPVLIVKGKAVAPRRVLLIRKINSTASGATVLRRVVPLSGDVSITSVPAGDRRTVARARVWNEPDLIAFEEAAAPRTLAAEIARAVDCPVMVGIGAARPTRKAGG